MAITITQHADTPNLANNRLLYAVTSISSSKPQYRFVLDINDDSGTLLQRLKQQPNPNDTGIFDIGQIITNYTGPTDEVWEISAVTANTACAKQFQVRVGEEYATTVTSSATLYTGDSPAAAGNPNVSSSNYHYFIDGAWDPTKDGFDWAYATKYDEESTDGTTTFSHQNGLTAFDTHSIKLNQHATISFLNGNTRGTASAAVDNGFAQDVYGMVVTQYDVDGGIVASDTIYNLAGPRTANTELWDDVYTSQDETTRLVHFPVGTQNLVDAGITLDSDLSYYIVSFHNQTLDPGVNDNGVYGEYRFNIEDPECAFDGTRFAWKNIYGVWDYFNFNLADTQTSQIARESYTQNFVDYSATNTVSYDAQRRGATQFQNSITQMRTAESDYLTQTEADNVRELFYSANVFAYIDSKWQPIVIETANVTEKTNNRSQKLFRYTVEYKLANQPQARG